MEGHSRDRQRRECRRHHKVERLSWALPAPLSQSRTRRSRHDGACRSDLNQTRETNTANFGVILEQWSRHDDQVRERKKQTMIHHISIAVRNPLRVADVLAEILEGQVLPAPPNVPKDSRVVFAGDVHGTLIEALPYGTELRPDDSEHGMRPGIHPTASFVPPPPSSSLHINHH